MNVGRSGVVALVEDHRLLAQSLAMSLRHAGFTVVVLDPCDEVVQRARDCRAALVLLDLNLGAPRSSEGGGRRTHLPVRSPGTT